MAAGPIDPDPDRYRANTDLATALTVSSIDTWLAGAEHGGARIPQVQHR